MNTRSRSAKSAPNRPAARHATLIGITGKAGAGKSTASAYLCNQYDFYNYAFAYPLKEVACVMGFKNCEIRGTQKEKLAINEFWNISGRTFMQKLGTDICRDILPKVIPNMNMGKYNSPWIRLFDIYISEQRKKTHVPTVVDDVRFPDEAAVIRDHGGYIIRVVKPEIKKRKAYQMHASETEMNKIVPDYTIINDGTLAQLEDKIDSLLFD